MLVCEGIRLDKSTEIKIIGIREIFILTIDTLIDIFNVILQVKIEHKRR